MRRICFTLAPMKPVKSEIVPVRSHQPCERGLCLPSLIPAAPLSVSRRWSPAQEIKGGVCVSLL